MSCVWCVATAQDDFRARYGAFGHVALASHAADFFRIPGTRSCCTGFKDGSGTGLAGGVLVEFPLSRNVSVGARLAALTQPFSMTSTEGTLVLVNGVEQDGAFEHRLSGSFTSVGVEPLFGIRLFSSLFVHTGGRIAVVVSSSYAQLDALTLPARTGTFVNTDGTDSRKRTRNEFSGSITDTKIQLSPIVGLSYELPLNNDATFIIVPEVFYQLGVTNVMSDSTWRASSLRAGIALKWSPFTRTKQQPPEPPPEPEPLAIDVQPSTPPAFNKPSIPAPPPPTATLAVTSLDASGAEVEAVKLAVEEYASTIMTPLLPYVFFDENLDRIPTRYKSLQSGRTDSFDIDRVNTGDKLATYHELLNIVGKRMQMYPQATVTITGNNQDIREEKGNTQLSSRRAESVKRYLVDVWGVADNRIATVARGIPLKAANTLTTDGAEENRRAELSTNDARVLAPILTRDTLRTSNPPSIRFRPRLTNQVTPSSWNLTIKQSDKVLRVFEGTGPIPEYIDWNLDSEKASMPRTAKQSIAAFTVFDTSGGTAHVESVLEVEQLSIVRKKAEGRSDKNVDLFSFIVFDVRSSELQPEHNAALQVIQQHIHPTSSISITGYTDRLGDAGFNQQLAANRANTIATALKLRNAIVKGVGQADLYDSTIPEGRLYTRTVNVVVETPVKE